MNRGKSFLALASALTFSLIVYQVLSRDYFRWPKSGMERIEVMADVLRRIKKPASWCYPADSSPRNLAVNDYEPVRLDECFSKLSPTSDFIEQYPQEYMKRFYGAEIDGFTCEVTLSTFWNDDHFVGSRCYYGFFPTKDFPGLGATDERFG